MESLLAVPKNEQYVPLAEKLRPQTIASIKGQQHLLGENGFISKYIKAKKPASIILWGPPGCGKTTLAAIYASAFDAKFVQISAIFSGVADIKKIVQEAEDTHKMGGKTVLFVDEIHRFNKSQQDAFLPYVEKGILILVGATTENPSFELNNALLSRAQVLTLNSLNAEALEQILLEAEKSEGTLNITEDARKNLIELANGDGRYLLGLLETIYATESKKPLTSEQLGTLLQKKEALYDKDGEQHYNLISALQKSIRGSDPDAAIYWLNRMLNGGENPMYIMRRLIIMAVEDVGLADPNALTQCVAARDAFNVIGSPQGEYAIAQAVIYLALAPKSNASYVAYHKSKEAAKNTSHLNPPNIILNAPTKTMQELGYGKGYQYDHDTKHGFSGQNYFPDAMKREQFYNPKERGFEREMQKRSEYFKKLREKLNNE